MPLEKARMDNSERAVRRRPLNLNPIRKRPCPSRPDRDVAARPTSRSSATAASGPTHRALTGAHKIQLFHTWLGQDFAGVAARVSSFHEFFFYRHLVV